VPVPTAAQGGLGYRWGLGASQLAASLEARATRGRPTVAMAGGELTHPSGASLRAGFRVRDERSSFSAGAGYALAALRLDYAFVAERIDLGDSHRFAFTARF
jgi:hypothetical protein